MTTARIGALRVVTQTDGCVTLSAPSADGHGLRDRENLEAPVHRCVTLLLLITTACEDGHCYTPGHCFSTTYTYETGPWVHPPPTEGRWDMVATFDDGSDLTGYVQIDTEAYEVRSWSLCANGSPTGAFHATTQYVPNTSEADLVDGQVQLRLFDGSRSLFLSTPNGFLVTEPEGLVHELDGSSECLDCPDPKRVVLGDAVLSDKYSSTWFPCDD